MGKSIFTVTGITTTGDEKEVHVTGTSDAGNVKRALDVNLISGGGSILTGAAVAHTVANAAYLAGDQYGGTTTAATLTNIMPLSGGSGRVTHCRVQHNSVTSVANMEFDIYLFHSAVTLAGDNAVWDVSDTDIMTLQTVIPVRDAYWYASASNHINIVPPAWLADARVQAAAGSRNLYFGLRILEAVTPTPTSLNLWLKVE